MSVDSSDRFQQKSFSVMMVFLCFAIIGLGLLPRIRMQALDQHSDHLEISYQWPAAAAEIIEREVTSKLEGVISSVQGIRSIESRTSKGTGYISIELKDNANVDAIRFQIASLIRQTYRELPEQVSYPTLSINASLQRGDPVIWYALYATNASSYAIGRFAEETITPGLLRVAGVRGVKVWGATPYEWEIRLRPNIQEGLDITFDEVSSVVSGYLERQEIGKGFLKADADQQEMSLFMEFVDWSDPPSLEDIPIKRVGNRVVVVSDVADVHFAECEPISYVRFNGMNAVNIAVYASVSEDTKDLLQKTQTFVGATKSMLPPGYSISLSYNRADFVRKQLERMAVKTILSVAGLLLFVLITSRQPAYVIVMVLTMLATESIAVLLYYIFDVTIQLYVILGVSVSMCIITGYGLMMIEHIATQTNKRVSLPIVVSVLVFSGSLATVMMFVQDTTMDMTAFARVTIINLFVFVFVGLYLLPALMGKVSWKPGRKFSYRRRRHSVRVLTGYLRFIRLSWKARWLYVVIALITFGIPVYRLPDKIESDTLPARLYNEMFGTDWFVNRAKPMASKIVGGGLRLFTEYSLKDMRSPDRERHRTALQIRGAMPEGCTIHQMNDAVRQMESFLDRFHGIEYYVTSIAGPQNSSITVFFREAYESGNFPSGLQSQVESAALSLGGVDWQVYGVGAGFSNAVLLDYRSSRIQLEGYNYDRLCEYAAVLRDSLLKNRRVKEADITGPMWGDRPPGEEYYLSFDEQKVALHEIRKSDFYGHIIQYTSATRLGEWQNGQGDGIVYLKSSAYGRFDVWQFNNNTLIDRDSAGLGIKDFCSLRKRPTTLDIFRKDQQYRLSVAYNFNGPESMARQAEADYTNDINEILPLGYKAYDARISDWNDRSNGNYIMVVVCILIVFVLCSVLFESLGQALVITSLLPISFSGIFFAFYLGEVNFDAGGLASFVLVGGVVISAGIFIVTAYNNRNKMGKKRSVLQLYGRTLFLKGWPIALMAVALSVGLIPFLIDDPGGDFTPGLAAGTWGGLIFSGVAIGVYLPLFLMYRRDSDLKRR